MVKASSKSKPTVRKTTVKKASLKKKRASVKSIPKVTGSNLNGVSNRHISQKTRTLKEIEARLEKNENTLMASLPWIRTNVRNIMKVIARYDKNSEQYINSQFEKFEMYSKSIELDIESKIDENTNILGNALDHINRFISEQKNLKRIELEDNIKNNSQIHADINVLKEEFTILIDEYKELEKAIINIKKTTDSKLNEEDTHIIQLVKELKGDIKNIDNVLVSEKQKIKDAVASIVDVQKKEFDDKIKNNLNISKAHQDNLIKSLLAQISTISTKNDQLVKMINDTQAKSSVDRFKDVKLVLGNIKTELGLLKDTQDSNDSRAMDYIKTLGSAQAPKYDDAELIDRISALESTQKSKSDDTGLIDRINVLENSQRSHVELIKDAVSNLKETSTLNSSAKGGELVSLLETYKKRDAEREKRVSNMLSRIEQAVETINQKAEDTSTVSEKDVSNELDSMISELKKLQQESN